jgi:signal transduction histidine kinase
MVMIAAFGSFTLRPGGRWGFGRERHTWDAKALLSIPLTFVLIFVTGYIGSGIVLVPGAQTFESLKDLSVFLCVVLLGYPALIAVPPAYMLSDLIEGVPPAFLQDWFIGYFINPACFWVAYQLIGKDPDFLRLRTWARYLLFVVIFMSVEPELWGYVCSGKFTPEISYRNITPALFFTTAVTWSVAPFAMLGALPLARRFGLFWAEIPGRVQERRFGQPRWIWESGGGGLAQGPDEPSRGMPIRVFLAAPFIGLLLLMVSAVAYLALRGGENAATTLASRLNQEIGKTTRLQLDDYFATAHDAVGPHGTAALGALLGATSVAAQGRAFIVDRRGQLVASSKPEASDQVVREAIRALERGKGSLAALDGSTQFEFEVVTAKPLSRGSWLAQATPYQRAGQVDWLEVTAMPEADFLSGVRVGHSQSAMVIAVALVLSLLVAPLLAGAVTAPILRVSRSAHAMAHGDLAQRVASSRLEELGTVAASFNYMAEQLQQSRRELEADIERRTQVEQALRESEDHLEELVEQRTQELAVANRELEAFSYSVSHDLRAPLRAVDGFARMLTEDYSGRLDDEGRQHLERIRKATENMSNLIDCLLDLARVTRRELKTQPIDLSGMAQEIARELQQAEPSRKVALNIEQNLQAEADPMLMRQALQNLLSNAWKFTARVGEAEIKFGCAQDNGERTFYVADNGAGFDMAYVGKLFGAFQRLHGSREYEGTGVGLAIVQRIVHRHNGRVWAEGAVNRGATIHFTLPLKEPGLTSAPPRVGS